MTIQLRPRGKPTGPALLRGWFSADKSRTQTALGHELGVSQQAVSCWASGEGAPDVLLWPLLEALTGIPGVAFLSGRALRAHERRELRLAQLRALQADAASASK